MDGVPFSAQFEQQMALAQRKVQDLLLQAKEEEEWEQYCRKHDIPLPEDANNDSKIEYHPTYIETGVQVEIRNPPKVKPPLKRNLPPNCSVASQSRGSLASRPTSQNKGPLTNEQFSSIVKSATENLFRVHASVNQLKAEKALESRFSKENVEDPNCLAEKDMLFQKSLQCAIDNMSVARRVLKSPSNEDALSCLSDELRKGVTFQIPYVIQEKRALDRRRALSSPQSSSQNLSKNVSKRPPPAYPRRNSRVQRKSSRHETHSSKKEENVEDGHISDEFIKNEINTIAKKLHEIEEKERLISNRWKAQKDALATETYNVSPRKSTLTNNARRKILESKSVSATANNGEGCDSEKQSVSCSDKETSSSGESSKAPTICGRMLNLDPHIVKNIVDGKQAFAQYLRETFHLDADNPIPWKSYNEVAESILNDCLRDVAEELQDMPQSIILDLYESEFVPQVL